MVAVHERASPPITRWGAPHADIPFLAEIEEIASKPPFEYSMWDALVAPFGVTPRAFLEAMLAANAANWGAVEDFLVLEVEGRPVAACAVFDAPLEPCDRRPVKLERLPEVGRLLGWDTETTNGFRDHYNTLWGAPDPIFLQPQAPVLIESVGVLDGFRGRGLGERLMLEAKATAKERGYDTIGIMVIHGNDRAQQLYERHFERWASFYPAVFDHKFPGLTKYRAKLTSTESDPDQAA
ncbi:MAG: GNAT family N-acetyltransferase [Alphaproteobacteria bacterium]|nr:MAG: GNAT family N-acetyltransferase [Alphaproteobacteria bacterium]